MATSPEHPGAAAAPQPLQALIDPRSVAIIGASENPNKIGGRPIHYMRRFGYAGAIYPINPNRDELQGLPCYGSLAALPAAPELAIIVVSHQRRVRYSAAGKRRTKKSATPLQPVVLVPVALVRARASRLLR